jgi:hypothetical protein
MKKLKKWNNLRKSKTFTVILAVSIVALMSLVFALRYKAAFIIPNFYAEDGSIFVHNILDSNILIASLTPFNGYLVSGQYLVAGLAFIPYYVLDLPFTTLPILIACASCLFLGLSAALPFILFRNELGWIAALVTSFLIAFVPLPGSDFAIIGTIGNLKFVFLFWAVLFIIYRNLHHTQKSKVFVSDAMLLLCIVTNGPVAALLPFILWPYKQDIWLMIKNRSIDIVLLRRPDIVSALLLCGVSFIYVVVVYLNGIPEIANYLQSAYIWGATDNIIHRVTAYVWLYPFATEMTGVGAMVILSIILACVFVINDKGRKVFLFGLFAIAVATLAFVLTRTGVSEHMLDYDKTPDQFFYAQSMVFIFISMWVISRYMTTRKRDLYLVGVVAVFIISAAPYGSSFGKNGVLYESRGDIYRNTSQACLDKSVEKINIPIYPSETWIFEVDRSIACK